MGEDLSGVLRLLPLLIKLHSLPHHVAHYQVDDGFNAIAAKTAVIPKHQMKRPNTFFHMNERLRRKTMALTGNKKAEGISTRLLSTNQ